MPDEVDVAEIARALPYRDEEVQRAHEHLKLAIEAAAAIALSRNRTLDSAASMVGSAIKNQALSDAGRLCLRCGAERPAVVAVCRRKTR